MAAGDGLLVRVRPRLARLDRVQTIGLCEAALRYGNGQIDLTNRANFQIRGVAEADVRALVETLCDLGLVDPDPVSEARRAILVAPDWRAGDDSHRLALELTARLSELPELPGKMGFAIDAGAGPQLGDDPADFRIERGTAGGLILRAEGRERGVAVAPGTEIDALIALAHWFLATGGAASGRMARHPAVLPEWAAGADRPAPRAASLSPGRHPLGTARGLPFGRIDARALAASLADTAAVAIRATPWRILIVEGVGIPVPAKSAEEAAAIRTDACVGAPACPQASVETRTLARRLAPHIAGRLHVSGCAKGCAQAKPADVVLTGRDGRFDLAFDARAGDPSVLAGLGPHDVLAHFGAD
jgi:precorrin-3B synthase